MMKYLMVFCILIGGAGHASENICNGVDKFDLICADLKRKGLYLRQMYISKIKIN